MNLLNWMFRKKTKKEIPPMPSWKTVVEMMQDKNLDAFADEVVDVIYSKDRSIRYVILKDEKRTLFSVMCAPGDGSGGFGGCILQLQCLSSIIQYKTEIKGRETYEKDTGGDSSG